jgi:PiT family inorganic phosphate transporter
MNFVGALVSSEVAKTVGRDIADPTLLQPSTFLAAVMIAPAWVALCTWKGLPISCSHSLMGGLIGAVVASAGVGGLKSAGIKKIVFGVFTSPVIGFAMGLALIVLLYWIVFWIGRLRPNHGAANLGRTFGLLQLVSASLMAFSHGTGDAQKAMGIITGALISGGFLTATDTGLPIPMWVRIACASAMALGTAWGGWRVIRTLGMRLAHLTGVPISTTHTITGAIFGVGAARGIRAVRWGIGTKILFAWFVTFPACIGGGFVLDEFFRTLGWG